MESPTIIGFAGPSASGKTTVCKKLLEIYSDSILIKLDNYWKNPKHFPIKNGYKNFELPDCLNYNKFVDDLRNLKNNKETTAPRVKWSQDDNYEQKEVEYYLIEPAKIIFTEGFLLYNDKRVVDLIDLKFFVDVPDEVILKRRLERRRSGREEVYYREVVISEYHKYGEPTKKFADHILDGTKPLEDIISEAKQYIDDEIQ